MSSSSSSSSSIAASYLISKNNSSHALERNTLRPVTIESINCPGKKTAQEVCGDLRSFGVFRLEHPNVVRYFGCEIKDENTLHLVTERCTIPLTVFIKEFSFHSQDDNDEIMRGFCLQILRGLAFLHERGIPVGSANAFNPDSIFFHDGQMKIDHRYGLSVESGAGKKLPASVHYVAPEVLENDDKGLDSFAAGIWSFGCIVFELLTGNMLFTPMSNPLGVLYKISICNIQKLLDESNDISVKILANSDAGRFLKTMLVKDPKDRATAQDLLRHPWMLLAADDMKRRQQQQQQQSTSGIGNIVASSANAFSSSSAAAAPAAAVAAANSSEGKDAGKSEILSASQFGSMGSSYQAQM